MTRATEVRAINCTACGAGLDVLGGGRVLVHICPYCGAELDASADYRVLSQYDGLERPDSPLRIGMRGPLRGVEFTVIGTLGMAETWRGRTWSWVEHQVFSPTHGYGWLTWEEGHLLWTRKYRGRVDPLWMSSERVETADARPYVESDGRTFRYYETSFPRITFAEGEFNWRPRIGDQSAVISMLADGEMLDFVETATEREVERTTYLPLAETLEAFGAEPREAPHHVHPVQPPWRLRDDVWMLVAGGLIGLACLVMGGLMAADTGRPVVEERSFAVEDLPQEVEFELTDTEKLALIRIRADVSNSWAWLEAGLTGPDGAPVFEAGREIGYYSGRDGDGAWTEGSQTATLRFHPPQAGSYTLELAVPDAGTWERAGKAVNFVTLSVREGARSGAWLMLVAVLLILPGAAAMLGRTWSRAKRWKGSDWSEEDDD